MEYNTLSEHESSVVTEGIVNGDYTADCDDCGHNVSTFLVYEDDSVLCYNCFEAESQQ
jgi:formylmethanofuran dehydrogenase subunit E